MSKIKLTAAQQNQTLSAKVQKAKKPKPLAKNVLAQPYNNFWPEISVSESEQLANLLFSSQKDNIQPNKSIEFGLNATLRALKQNTTIEILLISADIKPRFIVEQIIFQALNTNDTINILCVPKMNENFKNFTKFSCLSVIFVKSSESSPYTNAIAWIKDTSKRFPIKNSLAKILKRNNSRLTSTNEILETKSSNSPKLKTIEPEEKIDFSKLYLPKTMSERFFVPSKIARKPNETKPNEMMNNWSDYISFNDDISIPNESQDDIEMNEDEKSNNSELKCVKKAKTKKKKVKIATKSVTDSDNLLNYVTLRVNRIQGNPNKKKKSK